ncbi:GntR family transcriptional regulator [Kouleothrix sp.]|uniref:GntR family transcriptional regulator n=1 Tax=Kouleothrix sp. TaxID=2779161 RepID=UPI00391D9BE8
MNIATEATAAEPSIGDALWQTMVHFAGESPMLVDTVYCALWKQIVAGERQPGENLSDSELAAELGVSRTPVRQALHQLQRLGLVQTGPRRGFHVTIFRADDIRELYDLRTVLEVAAVRAATPRVELARMQAALAQIGALRAGIAADAAISARLMRGEIDFHHDMIAANAGNRRLAEAIAQQRAQIGIFLIGGLRDLSLMRWALDEHEQIVRAMIERDAEHAAAAMHGHIQAMKERVLVRFAAPRSR